MGHYLSEMVDLAEEAKARNKRLRALAVRIEKVRRELFSDETIIAQKLREAEMWLLGDVR